MYITKELLRCRESFRHFNESETCERKESIIKDYRDTIA